MAAGIVLIPAGVAWWIGVRDPIQPSSSANRPRASIARALGLLPPAVALGAAFVALVVWTPAYFVEVHNQAVGRSGLLSAAMPAIAIGAILAIGRWFRHSRGPGAAQRGALVLGVTAAALAMVSQASGLLAGFVTVALATALVGASSSIVLSLFPRMTSPTRRGVGQRHLLAGLQPGRRRRITDRGKARRPGRLGRGVPIPGRIRPGRRHLDHRLVHMDTIPPARIETRPMNDRQPKHRAVMDLGREEWLDALGMDAADIPKAVIMEGSWWRAQRTEWRLSYLGRRAGTRLPGHVLRLLAGDHPLSTHACTEPPEPLSWRTCSESWEHPEWSSSAPAVRWIQGWPLVTWSYLPGLWLGKALLICTKGVAA